MNAHQVNMDPAVDKVHPWRWIGITACLGTAFLISYVITQSPHPPWLSFGAGFATMAFAMVAIVASALTVLQFVPERRRFWMAIRFFIVGEWAFVHTLMAAIALHMEGVQGILNAPFREVMWFFIAGIFTSLPAIVCGFVVWLFFAKEETGSRRRCPNCNYDLQGTRYSALCPECGAGVRNGFNMPLSPESEDRALEVLAKGESVEEEQGVDERAQSVSPRGPEPV